MPVPHCSFLRYNRQNWNPNSVQSSAYLFLYLKSWPWLQKKTNACWLPPFYIHAYHPKWVLNAARQSYCNYWIYSLSLDKYKPLTPSCDSTFTQKMESARRGFLQGPAPTFIHLPPSVPIHSAFSLIIRVELSSLFSPTPEPEYCFRKFLASPYTTITFPTGSILSE